MSQQQQLTIVLSSQLTMRNNRMSVRIRYMITLLSCTCPVSLQSRLLTARDCRSASRNGSCGPTYINHLLMIMKKISIGTKSCFPLMHVSNQHVAFWKSVFMHCKMEKHLPPSFSSRKVPHKFEFKHAGVHVCDRLYRTTLISNLQNMYFNFQFCPLRITPSINDTCVTQTTEK
jgi:hypothetical protein